MRRERAQQAEAKVGVRRQQMMESESEEEKPKKPHPKQRKGKPVDEVFETIHWLSKKLNESNFRNIEEEKMEEVETVLGKTAESLSLEEIHHLEYSNRICYLLDLVARKNLKFKAEPQLSLLLRGELGRVEKLYLGHLENTSWLEDLKAKSAF